MLLRNNPRKAYNCPKKYNYTLYTKTTSPTQERKTELEPKIHRKIQHKTSQIFQTTKLGQKLVKRVNMSKSQKKFNITSQIQVKHKKNNPILLLTLTLLFRPMEAPQWILQNQVHFQQVLSRYCKAIFQAETQIQHIIIKC